MRVVGVDIGGTFTDFMLYDTESGVGARAQGPARRPASPSGRWSAGSPSSARRRASRRRTSTGVFHGTTVATNAVLEHEGAVAGMITTQRLPRHRPHRPPPAAAALLGDAGHPVAGAAVRAAPPPQGRDASGSCRRRARCSMPLDEDEVRAAARELQRRRASRPSRSASSSRTSTRSTSAARPRSCARRCPDAFVTTSADIVPQFREFERFTTATMSAFVGPKTGRYLERLAARARRARASPATCT